MPVHDWSCVKPGTYHNFHLLWTSSITNRLNSGLLPEGLFAMAEQVIGGPETDVVTLQLNADAENVSNGNLLVESQPQAAPSTSIVMKADADRYVLKANRITIRHELGEVLAVIELVSPGNKNSRHEVRSFIEKSLELIYSDINLLVIDPLPPGTRDPQGVHGLIWSEITDEPFELPDGLLLTIASYKTRPIKTAYVEPVSVGMELPTMPLFLQGDVYVNLPLEETYAETWNVLSKELRRLVEG